MSKAQFIVGLHAVEASISRHPERFIEIYALKGRRDQRLTNIVNQAEQLGISVQFMARKALDNKVGDEHHQGIIAKVLPLPQRNENDLMLIVEQAQQAQGSLLILILDGVTDPHNLGACMRSADAAGVDAIIVPKDNAAKITTTVQKVACGAAESVPFIVVTNLARTMRALQQASVWIIGSSGNATSSLYQTELTGSIAIAMGAEGSGLRRLTKEHCDEMIYIPMNGTVSSLNVSVATGICLFEVIRQRQL